MQLREATDEHGELVFASVDYGLTIPNLTITEDNCPAVRIWQDGAKGVADSAQFFVREMSSPLSIYVAFHALPDSSGNYPDIQQKRTEIVKFLLRSLEYPDASAPDGLMPDPSWWFELPQEIAIDHTTPLRRLDSQITVLPPWYVTRIDLMIRVKNYP